MKKRLFSLVLSLSVVFTSLDFPVVSYASNNTEAVLFEESESEIGLPIEDELPYEAEKPVDDSLPVEDELPDESEKLVDDSLPVEDELPDESEKLVDDSLPVEDELPDTNLVNDGTGDGDSAAFADFSGIDEISEEKLLHGSTNASKSVSRFDIDVTFGQSEARSMLDMVNEFRTGSEAWAWDSSNSKKVYYSNLKELKYDYGLEKVAMQRAAELAATFSHSRPDGSSCFSAYSVLEMCGENIAAGYWSAGSVFTAWREDDDDYDFQGHRRNMLTSSFKYIGIGHAVVDGFDYWVQEFNSVPTSLTYTAPDDDDSIVSIDVANDEIKSIDVYLSYENLKMDVGEVEDLPEVQKYLVLNGSFYDGAPVHVDKIEYKGYDPGIVSIDTDSGTITGIKAGKTSVTVSAGGAQKTFSVEVKSNPDSEAYSFIVKKYMTLKDADADTNGTVYSKTGTIDIPYGQKIYLRSMTIPATAGSKNIKIHASGANCIEYSLKTGELLAKQVGEAVLTFISSSDESKTVTIKIRVTEVPLTAISFDDSTIYMNVSSEKSITLRHTPEFTSEKIEGITWTSSDPSVLEVSGDGEKAVLRSGAKEGIAVITAVIGTLSASVTVKVLRIVDLSGNTAEYIAKPGATDRLKVKLAGSDYKENDLVWTSSDTSLVSINSGNLTIRKNIDADTKVTITAKTRDGLYSDSCEIILHPWERAQNPTVSLKPGAVEKNSRLVLSTKDAGTEVFYTIDSNEKDGISKPSFDADGRPLKGTILFDEAIIIDKNMTVSAVARKDGLRDSEILSFKYTILYEWGDVSNSAVKALFKEPSDIPQGLWYAFGNEKDGYKAYYTSSDNTSFSKTFTGSKITFNQEIRVFHGNRRLWENRDYTVSYSNNTKAASFDAKSAPTVALNGNGSYSGTARFTFSIKAKPLSGAMVTSGYEVSIPAGAKLSSVKPVVQYDGKKLSADKDYDMKFYEGSVSEATLIANPSKVSSVVGKKYVVEVVEHNSGNYSGKLAAPVVVRTVDPKDKTTVTMSKTKVSIPALSYDAGGFAVKELFKNGTAKVSYGKKVLEFGKDYDVTAYALSGTATDKVTEAGSYTVLVHGKGSGKEGDTVFVGDKSATLKINGIAAGKVKVAGLTSEVSYKGSAFVLEDLFKKDKTSFEKVTLYTVAGGENVPLKYSANNSKASSYDVEISGSGETGKLSVIFHLKGGYTGTIKKTVTVKGADISKATINVGDAIYSKAGAVPSVSAVLGDRVLKEGIDYRLSYKNNTKPAAKGAEPLVTIKGIGNYRGSVSRGFNIKKAPLSQVVTTELADKAQSDKKGGFKVMPKLTDGSKELVQGTDILTIDSKKDCKYYYVSSGKLIPDDAIIPAGVTIECRIVVTCPENSPYEQGKYELSGSYRIIESGMDISKATVKTAPSAAFSFDNGRTVIPVKSTDFTVTLGKTQLKPSEYEIISICDSRFIGNVKVTIRGKAPYGGTKTFTIRIGSRTMN